MSFEKPTTEFEQTPRPKIEIENQYQDFVPQEFKDDPLGYFESKGVNIKSGEVQYDEAGKIKEDPTAVKDLPEWIRPDGEKLDIVGKRVNVEKSHVGKSGNPFYEYKIMEIAAEFALPGPRPVAKVEQAGKHLIVMEKVPGIRWTERDMKPIHESSLTEADKQDLLRQAEAKMAELQKQFESIGLTRTWKLKDMIADVDIEHKTVMNITPTDWERTKIDPERLAQARAEILEATSDVKAILKDTIFNEKSLERWKRLFPEEIKGTEPSNIDAYADAYIKQMAEEHGKDYLKFAAFAKGLSKYRVTIEENLQVYPNFFRDAFDEWSSGNDIFTDEKTFSSYTWNQTLRAKDKIEDEPARMKERFMREPLADDDECNAGVYREELEAQVSNAIFALRKKGYSTFQSGFDNLVTGSQFIDFNQEDTDILKQALEIADIKQLFEAEKVKPSLEEKSDRATFILIPDNPQQTMESWKKIWDTFAQKMPDKGKQAEPPTNLGSYGIFMKRQMKIRDGEKTYLGYGMEYDGGKVLEKDPNDTD